MFIMCFALATAHTAEHSYGRQPDMEVAKVKGLSPPGLGHQCLTSYRSHLYSNNIRSAPNKNIKANIVKEDTVQKRLRIATINVTSWSPKIVTCMSILAKEYDILLIQEHHKFRAKDMKTGPYIIASFAPAQKTVPSKNGKGWHSTGCVAILVRDHLYFEKDKHILQHGLKWAAVKIRLRKQPGHKHQRGNSSIQ